MSKDGKAEGSFAASVIKKTSGMIFFMLARSESRVEMQRVRETLRGAADFACWAGCSFEGGSHSREMCAQFPALGKSTI